MNLLFDEMKTMGLTLVFLAFLFSDPVFAVEQAVGRVSLGDHLQEDFIQAHASASNNEEGLFPLFADDPVGTRDGTDPNDPGIIYCPIDGGSGSGRHFVGTHPLPQFSQGNWHGMVRIVLEVEYGLDETAYLFAAARRQDNGQRTIVNRHEVQASDDVQVINFDLPISTLCNHQDVLPCSDFVGQRGGSIQRNLDIYLFMSTDHQLTRITNEEDYTGGVYLIISFSNNIIDKGQGDLSISIGNITRGDGSLFLEFNRNDIDNFRTLMALVQELTPEQPLTALGDNTVQSYLSAPNMRTHYPELEDLEGVVSIPGLNNGQRYAIGLVAVDSYQFATRVPPMLEGTPVETHEVLKQEGCYILSAGFDKDHFIVDYFRLIRDMVLKRFSLGQRLIRAYYKTAPDWVPIIKRSSLLKALVQTGAWALFLAINSILLGIGALIILSITRLAKTTKGAF